MGSLTKLAESQVKEEKSTGLFVKKAETEDTEERQYTSADRIKIAAAHLTNVIAAAKEDGRIIKEASSKEEIDPNLILKTAQLYVIDSYDLYKEAGISREGLMKLIQRIRDAAGQSKMLQKTIHPLAENVRVGAQGAPGVFGGKGYLAQLLGSKAGVAAKDLGTKGIEGVKTLAGKKGVQIGAGSAAGGLGLGYGLNELLND